MSLTKKEYWDDKYIGGSYSWDIGGVSRPIKEYIDQLADKDLRVLIPGAGNAYEAEYMHDTGFNNVFILEWSKAAVNNFCSRAPHFPVGSIINEDYFKHEGEYDIILEQTFFCAILPELRQKYADKSASLLRAGGKLVGLLFDCDFEKAGPPFGGNKDEYISYFEKHFDVKVFERCYNSIKPRAGRELFMILIKR